MTTLLQKNKAIVLFNRERKKEGKRERIARGRKKLGKGRREQIVDNRHLYYYGLTSRRNGGRVQRRTWAPRPTQFSYVLRYVFINGTQPEYRRTDRTRGIRNVDSRVGSPPLVPLSATTLSSSCLSLFNPPPPPHPACMHAISPRLRERNVTTFERRTLMMVVRRQRWEWSDPRARDRWFRIRLLRFESRRAISFSLLEQEKLALYFRINFRKVFLTVRFLFFFEIFITGKKKFLFFLRHSVKGPWLLIRQS